ncbi:MAG: NigD-like C-terminal domain-containing protein [Ignavibacteriaceae bacterium]
MMIKIFTFLSAVLILLLLGCNENSSINDSGDLLSDNIIITDNVNVKLKNDYLKVLEQYVSGDYLILKVQYSGGCKEHEIKVYTTGAILKTNPPQAELFISHNADNDSCEALITKELKINLIELKIFYKTNFNRIQIILLRIYEPNSINPVLPLLEYRI